VIPIYLRPGPLNHFLPSSAEKSLLFYTRNLIFLLGIVESCIAHSGAECNRQDWSPATRLIFGQDTPSRIIDVPGADRVIRRVDFYYRSLGVAGGGRAIVELWGK